MAPHSSTLAWKIPWTEEPGRLQSMGSLRIWHNWATSLPLSCIGEGDSNPLQCSCLGNPRDGGASWIAVYGVAQSRTRLKRLSSSSSRLPPQGPWFDPWLWNFGILLDAAKKEKKKKGLPWWSSGWDSRKTQYWKSTCSFSINPGLQVCPSEADNILWGRGSEATHSSVLALRIPGTGEPGGLPSMGSHRVGHDWSDLATAAAAAGGVSIT